VATRTSLARRIRPGQVVVIAFIVAIAVGTVLLWLPVSRDQDAGALRTAFFTATSAVCVTGHSVVDTPGYWSTFGQVVIMALIQVGGFGIVAAGSVLFLVAGRRLGLRGRLLTQNEAQAFVSPDAKRVLIGVAAFTLVVEVAVGVAVTLRLWLGYDHTLGDAAWRGAFHAVSAFNQGGFTLYEDSLIRFATDGWIVVPLGLAVIVGSLGYPVFVDLRRRGRRPSLLTVYTKLTLLGTVLLLVGGAIAFAVTEWTNERTLGGLSAPGRILSAWFMSLTTRSAGLNTIDVGAMRDESWLLADMLMFVGGGSGSTAGGIKIATFLVLFLIVLGEARGGRPAEAFGRAISPSAQRQALTVAFTAFNVIAVGTILLLALTPYPFGQCVFEVISAFSTTGLSTGITSGLSAPAQIVLALLIFLGRVGPLTLVVALAVRERDRMFTYPEERPLIG
jgi:trk system potassium uptake protein